MSRTKLPLHWSVIHNRMILSGILCVVRKRLLANFYLVMTIASVTLQNKTALPGYNQRFCFKTNDSVSLQIRALVPCCDHSFYIITYKSSSAML